MSTVVRTVAAGVLLVVVAACTGSAGAPAEAADPSPSEKVTASATAEVAPVWEAHAVLSHCIQLSRTSLNITAHDAAGHSGFASHPVQALVSDHQSPYWKIFTGSPTEPLRWEWTEDVVGISNESAAVGHFENHVRIPVPGSWSCLQADGSPVDCVAGPVRLSIYTPTITLVRERAYEATFNPPGILAVTDLAGNPAHRFNWYFPRA